MPYETFIVAVAIAGLYAGVGPAILAIILGAVVGNYFFVQPRLRLVAFATREDWAAFIGYVVASVLIVVLIRARTKVSMSRRPTARVTGGDPSFAIGNHFAEHGAQGTKLE